MERYCVIVAGYRHSVDIWTFKYGAYILEGGFILSVTTEATLNGP